MHIVIIQLLHFLDIKRAQKAGFQIFNLFILHPISLVFFGCKMIILMGYIVAVFELKRGLKGVKISTIRIFGRNIEF